MPFANRKFLQGYCKKDCFCSVKKHEAIQTHSTHYRREKSYEIRSLVLFALAITPAFVVAEEDSTTKKLIKLKVVQDADDDSLIKKGG